MVIVVEFLVVGWVPCPFGNSRPGSGVVNGWVSSMIMVLNIAVFGSGWGFGQPVQNSMLMFDVVVSLVEWNTYLYLPWMV